MRLRAISGSFAEHFAAVTSVSIPATKASCVHPFDEHGKGMARGKANAKTPTFQRMDLNA